MATVSAAAAASPYAAFAELPIGPLMGVGARGPSFRDLPSRDQADDAGSGAHSLAAIFDMAREVKAEQTSWTKRCSAQEAERRERQEVMRVACQKSPPTKPDTLHLKGRRAACKYGDKCYNKKSEHTGRFAHPGDADYDAPQGSVTIDFNIAGKRKKHSFSMATTVFEIKVKAYELLGREAEFKMFCAGPTEGRAPRFSRELEEGTFDSTLSALELKAGCTYEVEVVTDGR